MSRHSSPFPACFRPSATTDDLKHHSQPYLPPPPPPISGQSNLTTCLYHTHLALFSLTWSRSFLSRSLHLYLHSNHHPFDSPLTPPSLPSPSSPSSSTSFHLQIKPFVFWKKNGSKKISANFHVYWDLNRARFGSGPEPHSGFYIAVVVDNEIVLIVGDLVKEAHSRTKALKPQQINHKIPNQSLILKREHVIAPKIYTTKARFGGKIRSIQIDCSYNDDSRLCFSVDNKTVLKIKRLKWKFRGNERVEVDGVPVQISWDVYNWIFEDEKEDGGHAVFMFRFEDQDQEEINELMTMSDRKNPWAHCNSWSMGMISGIERKKMRKSISFSSVSLSSSAGSSAGSSSVMEWANMEESELSGGPSGFSLLIYAWKR